MCKSPAPDVRISLPRGGKRTPRATRSDPSARSDTLAFDVRYKEDLPADLKQQVIEVKDKLPDQLVDVCPGRKERIDSRSSFFWRAGREDLFCLLSSLICQLYGSEGSARLKSALDFCMGFQRLYT